MMVSVWIVLVSYILLLPLCISTRNTYEDNKTTKEMIEEAGCPFVSDNQYLVRDVCLLPNYENNQMPVDPGGKVMVNVSLFSALVIEVDEKRSSLTVKLSQFLEWRDSRIRLRKSDTSIVWLSQQHINDIWHPDLNIHTGNLMTWNSHNVNALYGKLVILKDHFASEKMKNGEKDSNAISASSNDFSLGALKSWTAKLRCVFDFTIYPFDSNECRFVQFGIEGMNLSLKQVGNRMEWSHKIDGFDIEIKDIGAFETDLIGFNILIKRMVEPYFYQYYLPCMAIVIVSLVSFLIPISALPGRIALVVTQFLTLTNIFMHQIVSRLDLHLS